MVGEDPASLYSIGIYPVGDALVDPVRGIDLARNGEDGDKAMHRDRRIKNADECRDPRLVLRHHQLKQTVTPRDGEAEHGHAGKDHPPHQREIIAGRERAGEQAERHSRALTFLADGPRASRDNRPAR